MSIEIKHVRKEYENATPLKDINAIINDGDVVSIIGPSGCGKSTLLRSLNMIDAPTSGQIIIDGEDITSKKCDLSKLRQKVGMVFQSYNLFEHLTLVENVMLAQTDLKHRSKKGAYKRAVEELKKVGLEKQIMQYPDQISGGQKQRASIARTLAMDPEIILLDEPTSALDPSLVREVETVIKNLAKSGKTMVVVTHEMRLAKAISNKIFYLDQGKLYEEGTPEQIFEHPKKERTKAFVNHLKVVKNKFKASQFVYGDFSNELTTFYRNNDVPTELYKKLEMLFLWFETDLIPMQLHDNYKFNVIVEYNEDKKTINILIYAEDIKIKTLLLKQLKSLNKNATVKAIKDEDYSIKASCIIK